MISGSEEEYVYLNEFISVLFQLCQMKEKKALKKIFNLSKWIMVYS